MSTCIVTPPAQVAALLGVGLNTPIGTTLARASAAWRGRINRFRAYDRLPSARDGRPLTACVHGHIGLGAPLEARMLALAAGPMQAAIAGREKLPGAKGRPLVVYLSLPPPRPGWGEEQSRSLAQKLIATIPFAVDRERSALINSGHHGAIALIRRAMEEIGETRAEDCLVGGVDSWIDVATLDWLDGQGRLKGPARPDGMIPGEGAAFLLLGSANPRPHGAASPKLRIVAAGESVDPTPWYLGAPIRGDGLAALLQALLTEERPVAGTTYADLNGEAWRVDEWMVAYLRSGRRHADPLNLCHPADCWGDLGAASGCALVALSAHELQHRPRASGSALVWTASDTRPFRSACLLTCEPEEPWQRA
jgi:3-oxoacyl-[acyl-carrier-protein] synthase-1